MIKEWGNSFDEGSIVSGRPGLVKKLWDPAIQLCPDGYTWMSRATMWGLNQILLDSVELIKDYGTRVEGVLIHGPEMRSLRLREFLSRSDAWVSTILERGG